MELSGCGRQCGMLSGVRRRVVPIAWGACAQVLHQCRRKARFDYGTTFERNLVATWELLTCIGNINELVYSVGRSKGLIS